MSGIADRVAAALLEDTDALTGNDEGAPDRYSVHVDDVPYLVQTVLDLAAPFRRAQVVPAEEEPDGCR